MQAFNPGVDCVVVNYHTMQDLSQFVMSYGHDPVESSLFVVNVEESYNEASDTRKLLSKIPGAQHHSFLENVGYATACNYGANQGDREVIAFFNADTQLYDDTLSKCHDALMSNRSWGIVGPLQIRRDGRVTHGGIFGTPTQPVHRGWMKTKTSDYRDVQEAVSVMGSAFFIKRVVWEELTQCSLYSDVAPDAAGAFLPTPHYFEETFCAYHAREHGYKVVYYGPAMMIHEWHQASPVGGATEKIHYKVSQQMFRDACDHHGIEHD